MVFSIPINDLKVLRRKFSKHKIRKIIDELAARPGYKIVYRDLVGRGCLVSGSSKEILVNKNDWNKDRNITILEMILEVKYPASGKLSFFGTENKKTRRS